MRLRAGVTGRLRKPAELELALIGSGSAERIVEGTYAEGTHRLLARLPAIAPSFRYRLQARFADGQVKVREGKLGEQYRRLDSLPLAQVMLSGVLLADGHLVTEPVELDLGGSSDLGEVARAYSSTLAEGLGPLGYGWRSNLHHLIRRNACGDFIVTAGNHATWFRENAAGELVPTRGFHGTLRREGKGRLVFYSKNGTRWVFEHLSAEGATWWLVEVASSGQEITRWVYDRAFEEPLLERVELPDGSALEVHHRRLETRGRSGMVISEWRSRGSKVVCSCDENGLLSTATESSGAGTTT